jgi:hypothetical protein
VISIGMPHLNFISHSYTLPKLSLWERWYQDLLHCIPNIEFIKKHQFYTQTKKIKCIIAKKHKKM